MVLKHTPLGEINLPLVASSANAPRCRRNRRSFRVGGTKKNVFCVAALHRGGEEDSPRAFGRSTLYVVLVQELGNQFLDGRHIDS